jgi:hypothetical protein
MVHVNPSVEEVQILDGVERTPKRFLTSADINWPAGQTSYCSSVPRDKFNRRRVRH